MLPLRSYMPDNARCYALAVTLGCLPSPRPRCESRFPTWKPSVGSSCRLSAHCVALMLLYVRTKRGRRRCLPELPSHLQI